MTVRSAEVADPETSSSRTGVNPSKLLPCLKIVPAELSKVPITRINMSDNRMKQVLFVSNQG